MVEAAVGHPGRTAHLLHRRARVAVHREQAPEVLEGEPQLTSAILIEFPDLPAARAWYDSPAHQPW